MQEERADAWRALQQALVRLLEVAAGRSRLPAPAVAAACRLATRLGRRAESLTRNGNRAALVRRHRLEFLALASLLRGRRPDPEDIRSLDRTRRSYANGGDIAGVGNCLATLAVFRAAEGDRPGAAALFDEAPDWYRRSRPSAPPPPSGVALVERLTAAIDARTRPPRSRRRPRR